MIARYRGEHHARGIWQPRRPSNPSPGPAPNDSAAPAAELGPDSGLLEFRVAPESGPRVHHHTRTVVLLVLLGLIASLVGQRLGADPTTQSTLPGTPRQWVDAYEAAALDHPGRVCSQLFSPQLAAAYAAQSHISCAGYFARVSSSSLRIRGIYQDGDAAVVQMRQTVQHTNWAAILDRHGAGWRAVELIAIR